MSRRTGTIAGAAVALVLVVVAGLVALRHQGGSDETELQQAMSRALPQGQRFSWTDWAAVRTALKADVGADSTDAEVQRFLTRGFGADLTSASALVGSTAVLQRSYGFSPATLDWELFTQSDTAAVLTLGLPAGTDLDALGRRLTSIAYAAPDANGVRVGDPDSIKRLGEVTPELDYLYLDTADRALVGSDTESGLLEGITSLQGAAGVPGLVDVVAAVAEPTSAEIYSSDQVCSALAMSHADDSDQAQAAQLLAQAGKVNPITGFAMANEPGGDVLVAMSFESEAQARTNATTRAKLAAGPAPGQFGDFSDRFTLGRVAAVGTTVTMQLKPKPGQYVLSDLSTGPLLFATC